MILIVVIQMASRCCLGFERKWLGYSAVIISRCCTLLLLIELSQRRRFSHLILISMLLQKQTRSGSMIFCWSLIKNECVLSLVQISGTCMVRWLSWLYFSHILIIVKVSWRPLWLLLLLVGQYRGALLSLIKARDWVFLRWPVVVIESWLWWKYFLAIRLVSMTMIVYRGCRFRRSQQRLLLLLRR